MRTIRRNYPSALFAAISLVFALSVTSVAQESQTTKVNIKNFGQMDDRFFRGGQPKEDQYKELAALGINTVIDLREDPEEYEQPAVEALGMRYINIPMIAKKYPETTHVEQFLKLVGEP